MFWCFINQSQLYFWSITTILLIPATLMISLGNKIQVPLPPALIVRQWLLSILSVLQCLSWHSPRIEIPDVLLGWPNLPSLMFSGWQRFPTRPQPSCEQVTNKIPIHLLLVCWFSQRTSFLSNQDIRSNYVSPPSPKHTKRLNKRKWRLQIYFFRVCWIGQTIRRKICSIRWILSSSSI